jgi:hypothetical protein
MLGFRTGYGPTYEDVILRTPYVFAQTTKTAPWIPRDGAGLLQLGGFIYMLGGWNPGAFAVTDTTNEVWRAPVNDTGNWTQLLGQDANPPQVGVGARWRPRHMAGWVVHNVGGLDYLYVIGGDGQDGFDPNGPGDVWRSLDGITWQNMTFTAPCLGRQLALVWSQGGALYIAGGQTNIHDKTTALNDVWRSTDGGVTWVQLANAPWAPRGIICNPMPIFNGQAWVIGGGTYDDIAHDFYNDSWSYNGLVWTQVQANDIAPWIARQYQSVRVFDNQLFLLNGTNGTVTQVQGVWRSVDGVTWNQLLNVPWQASHADGFLTAADGSKVIYASGNSGMPPPNGSGPAAISNVWEMRKSLV